VLSICCHDFAGPIDSHQCLKNVLGKLFVIFRVSGTAGYWFCLRVNQIRSTKSCSCLVSFVKVASGRFLVTYLYYTKWQQDKRENSIGVIPRLQIGDRYAWVSCASYSNRLFCLLLKWGNRGVLISRVQDVTNTSRVI